MSEICVLMVDFQCGLLLLEFILCHLPLTDCYCIMQATKVVYYNNSSSLAFDFLLHIPRSNSKTIYVRFVAQWHWTTFSSRDFIFPLPLVSQVVHTCVSPSPKVCNMPDQSALGPVLGLHLGPSLGCTQIKEQGRGNKWYRLCYPCAICCEEDVRYFHGTDSWPKVIGSNEYTGSNTKYKCNEELG